METPSSAMTPAWLAGGAAALTDRPSEPLGILGGDGSRGSPPP